VKLKVALRKMHKNVLFVKELVKLNSKKCLLQVCFVTMRANVMYAMVPVRQYQMQINAKHV
jgi:hypothetical protein